MAGNALEMLKMTRFCERFVFWNGYVRNENQSMDKVTPNWGAPVPSAPPPAQPLRLRAGYSNAGSATQEEAREKTRNNTRAD